MPIEMEAPELDEVEAIEEEVAADPEAAASEDEDEVAVDEKEAELEIVGDGRVIPKYIKDLQQNDPAGYKKAKEAFFQHRDFMAAFPEGPKAAGNVLRVMADIGGVEGLQGLQKQAEHLNQLVELAHTNPAAVLQELAQASPDKAEEVAVAAIGNWFKSNPESYDRLMSGVVAQSLSNIKFDSQLDKALLLLEVGRAEEGLKVIQQVRDQVAAFGTAAAAAPKQTAAQQRPDETAKNELQAFKEQTFDRDLGGAIIAYRDPMIFREAEQWTKGMTLNDRQKGSLVRDVTEGIGQLLQKDGRFIESYKALTARHDADGALKLYQEKAAKIGPGVVKDVARELFGSPVSGARKPAPVLVAKAKTATNTPARKDDKFSAIWNS